MSLTPSEYFDRQCHIGASFLRPSETDVARSVGTHKVMWGSDYPHIEGSHPHTKEHLRLTFANYTVEEATQMLTTNAAKVYGFDLGAAPTRRTVLPHQGAGRQPDRLLGDPGAGQGLPGHEPTQPT